VKDPAQPPERGLLARFVLDNYPLKLLSLVLAVALFSIVHSDQDAQRSMYIDVVALLPPRKSDKLLVSALPAQVKVTLRGSRSRIAALQHDDFAPLQMDLRETGRRYYFFDQSAIDVAGPVQVVGIEPSSVELIWRARAEHKVPVRAKLRGTPEEGYWVRKPLVISPATVTISGPKDEVDAVTEVFTDDIAIDGMGEGAHERRIQLEPLSGHLIYAEQNSVSVHIDVVAEQGERTLRHLDVAVLGAGEAALRPTAVAVTLRGPVRSLADIEPEQIVPFVELPAAVAAGVEVLEVKVRDIPAGFTVERIAPANVIAKRTR
jgi:YbbR domain-containing protein